MKILFIRIIVWEDYFIIVLNKMMKKHIILSQLYQIIIIVDDIKTMHF